ncbi:MAG: dienelactone hydrolase family protein [Alphaproteobacteria bacterium]
MTPAAGTGGKRAARWCRVLLAALMAAAAASVGTAAAQVRPADPWPDPASLSGVAGEDVAFPSSSPFAPEDIGRKGDDPPTTALGRLYLPPGRHAGDRVPAVILLHGAGGVIADRELTYAPQLAAMGIAGLVIDSFAARRDRATSFIARVVEITETMMMADAYAGLRYLAGRPDIDARRVVLTGFSEGAMAATYALYAQIAERLAPAGLRFAGHAAFYGPCITHFDDDRTTGAPLLMLLGAEDELTRPERCAAVAGELRAGGSAVEVISYPGAVHQWDGHFARRLIGRNLSDCRFEVERDGTVIDDHTGLAMSGPFLRKIILALCVSSKPYPIGRDDGVRALSNRDYGRFLARLFAAAGNRS